MEKGRLSGLDGLRGIAAAGVAVHHIFYHFAPWQFVAVPLAGLFRWLNVSGWTLVDLFFVLSGFVFAHVYVLGDSLKSEKGMADFWVARFGRLFPLHLAILVLVAILVHDNPANTPAAFVAHLAMMQAFFAPVAGTFVKASWSISIEMLCYVIFSLAARVSRHSLMWICILLAFIAGDILWIFGSPGGPWSGDIIWRGLLGFFLGQCLWFARDHLAKLPSWLLVALGVAGFILQDGAYSPLVPLTLLSWPAALVLGLRLRWLGSRPMVWLGDRSYAIYLINLPLISSVTAPLNVSAMSAMQILAVQFGLAISILLASEVSFRWLEDPARRAIRAAWNRRNARQDAARAALA